MSFRDYFTFPQQRNASNQLDQQLQNNNLWGYAGGGSSATSTYYTTVQQMQQQAQWRDVVTRQELARLELQLSLIRDQLDILLGRAGDA